MGWPFGAEIIAFSGFQLTNWTDFHSLTRKKLEKGRKNACLSLQGLSHHEQKWNGSALERRASVVNQLWLSLEKYDRV